MLPLYRLGSLAILAALAVPAYAQQAPQPNSTKDIVVTGRTQVPLKRAQRFVHQVVSMNEGQLARFVDPVCPRVLGARSELAGPIEQRFRESAAAAGVPLAPATCEPNVMIALVTDSDAFIKVVRKRHSSFFDDLQGVDLHDALRSGAVHSWRLIETRDDEGNGSGKPDDDAPAMYSSETQTVTVNAVVVMDANVVLGKSSRQIADYAVMRTLAGARPPKKGSVDASTILSLFDPNASSVPTEMTLMDRNLLAGLYAISGGARDVMAQMSGISRQMAAAPGTAGRRAGRGRR